MTTNERLLSTHARIAGEQYRWNGVEFARKFGPRVIVGALNDLLHLGLQSPLRNLRFLRAIVTIIDASKAAVAPNPKRPYANSDSSHFNAFITSQLFGHNDSEPSRHCLYVGRGVSIQ